jgi:hypothetical protein
LFVVIWTVNYRRVHEHSPVRVTKLSYRRSFLQTHKQGSSSRGNSNRAVIVWSAQWGMKQTAKAQVDFSD